MTIIYESQRLYFKKFDQSIQDELIAMNRDSQVMEFFPKTLTREESLSFYERVQDHYRDFGYGLYSVFLKEGHDFIGFIGLLNVNNQFKIYPAVEIGWRLKKEYWQKGYAKEGALKTLDYGFNQLGLRQIYSFTAQLNERSQGLMKALKMEKIMDFKHPYVEGPLEDHVLYRMRAEDFYRP